MVIFTDHRNLGMKLIFIPFDFYIIAIQTAFQFHLVSVTLRHFYISHQRSFLIYVKYTQINFTANIHWVLIIYVCIMLGTEDTKIKSESALKEFIIFSGRKGNKCSKRRVVKCGEYFKEQQSICRLMDCHPHFRREALSCTLDEGKTRGELQRRKLVTAVSSGSTCQNFVESHSSWCHMYATVWWSQNNVLLSWGRGDHLKLLLTHPLNHFFCSHESSYHFARAYWESRCTGQPCSQIRPREGRPVSNS